MSRQQRGNALQKEGYFSCLIRPLMLSCPRVMREELKKNEDIVFNHQNARVKMNLPNQARRYVHAGAVVAWLLLALASLFLWLIRLMGTINLPS